MPGPIEKIEVNRIFIGKSMIFGLFFGLLLGLIVGVFLFVTILIGGNTIELADKTFGPGLGASVVVLIGTILVITVASIITAFLGSFLYNLTSGMGGAIHIGLAEMQPGPSVPQQVAPQYNQPVNK